jgi:ubiquinone/menaquinone biosynthesis C-methylase UbiE
VEVMKKNVFQYNLAYSYSIARILNFSLQGRALPLISKMLLGKKWKPIPNLKIHLEQAENKIKQLVHEDVTHMQNGDYPFAVLKPESIVNHTLRVPLIYFDAVQANLRKRKNQTKKFKKEKSELLKALPEYYRRNFHHQTDGYLSEQSALIYEHQVEILFSGAADAMRRMIIPELKRHFQSSDGTGLKFLEMGSGTGALTRFIAMAFPKAHITCVDLSADYLKQSAKKLKNYGNINYIQGAGEQLDFKSGAFDAVYSCFLFHELPENIRQEMLSESLRILKKGGFIGTLDSIQSHDDPDFLWAIERFPVDFHEPYYKNYINKPLEKIFSSLSIKSIKTKVGFLSKVVTGTK